MLGSIRKGRVGFLVGSLIGRKVLWTQGETAITGKIVGFHGKNDVIRVKFLHGVPGQAIGTTITLKN
jgi:ribosomal protein L35AE/L33A